MLLKPDQIELLNRLIHGPAATPAAVPLPPGASPPPGGTEIIEAGRQIVGIVGQGVKGVLGPDISGQIGNVIGAVIGNGTVDPNLGGMMRMVTEMLADLERQNQRGAQANPGPCQDALTSRLLSTDAEGASAVLYFCHESAELTGNAASVLDVLASMARSGPGFSIQLMGHASADGDPGFNKRLSGQRGEAVKAYLVGKGLDGGQIEVLAMGSSMASGHEQEDRNVLAELKVMIPLGAGDKVRPAQFILRADGGEAQLFFAQDSAELAASAVVVLAICAGNCAPFAASLEKGSIRVYATASMDGDAGYNKSLSQQRAESVRAVLGAMGVPVAAVTTAGDGATNEFSKSDPSANRRAKVVWDLPQTPAGSSAPSPTPPAAPGGGGTEPPDPTPVDDRAALTSVMGSSGDSGGNAHLFFATGSAQLTGSARQVLDQVATLCKGAGHFGLTALGSADLDGDAGTNDTLSTTRAQAVEDYLVSKGLPEDLVFVNGIGGVDRYSKTEKAQNRRVELSWRLMQQAPGGGGDSGARPSAMQTNDEGGFAELYFAAGKVELSPSARSALDQCVADCVAPGANVHEGTLVVKAFASSSGDAGRDPDQLAEDRGDVVKDYLAQRGVDGKAISVAATATDHFSPKDPSANQVVTLRWTPRKLPPAGVVTPPPVKLPPQDLTLAFESGKTTLGDAARGQVDALGNLAGATAIRVDSYSSKDGNADRNMKLSLQRAKAVADYLVGKGAPAGVIKSSGHGGTDQFSKKNPDANRVTLVHVEF